MPRSCANWGWRRRNRWIHRGAEQRHGRLGRAASVQNALLKAMALGTLIRRADDLAAMVAFFEARNGRLHGFRFKDWADF
ncbi:DUF2460 domain-containing protein, partial [Paracoccus sp. DMF]|uniref:DUF2460 domain-containing protein n=1 Tax=Paracoccus sp. DMF TaxID=400837 RepID=UPI0021E50513